MKTLTRIYSVLQPVIMLLLTILGMAIVFVMAIIAGITLLVAPKDTLVSEIAGLTFAFCVLMILPEKYW